MLQKGCKVGIVCCSNGQKTENQNKIEKLNEKLLEMGLYPALSPFIYEKENAAAGTAKERAKALMDFYEDEEIKAIFDISGGDIANEILPYLDFDVIAKADKMFWGYSDLTTIINAIYTKTQKVSVLYQVRNLICQERNTESLIREFQQSVFYESQGLELEKSGFCESRGLELEKSGFCESRGLELEKSDFENRQKEDLEVSATEGDKVLFDFPYRFVRGEEMDGIVVGGNIRCLLKLAGTEYFPDMTDKILLLEAMSGQVPQMVTYFSQLQQMGVFDKVKGVLLGTFTKYEENHQNPPIEELVMTYLPGNLSVVKTDYVGHASNSKALKIGEKLTIMG